jgi:type IV secretory pathway VirJ component
MKYFFLFFIFCLGSSDHGYAQVTLETWKTERFGDLRLYKGNDDIYRTVIFFTGKNGWDQQVEQNLSLLLDSHTLVIGVPYSQYVNTIQTDPACRYLAGELIRLAQSIQNERDVAEPLPAIVAGVGEGAVIADRAYQQYPKDFLGELLLDRIPIHEAPLQLCANDPAGIIPTLKRIEINSNNNGTPTLLLNPNDSFLEQQRKKHEHIDNFFPVFQPSTVSELPLIFLPAKHHTKQLAVVFLSGDGGWAEIDIEISKHLNENGYSVLGFDALKFYWSKKDAQESIDALNAAINIAKKEFSVPQVAVMGFSLGADAAPFMVAGLTPEQQKQISSVVLLNPSLEADFEVHIADWLGVEAGGDSMPLKPQIKKITRPILCIISSDQDESVCRDSLAGVQTRKLPGDHHYDGEYETVSRMILAFFNSIGS